jgi:predicted alpha-1,6-mannanase (GH76 family)
MIWVMYGGIIAGIVLTLAAVVAVISPIVRTQRHAKAIAPSVLIEKFHKAQDDVDRVQGATVLAEELAIRARDAVARIKEAAEVLRSLRVVPTPNRD